MPRPGPRPYECVRRAWHSDRHQPIRGSLIKEIFRVAKEIHSSSTKHNKEWQEKLPTVVLKAEEIMYSKANSEAEYMDLKTLWDRTNDAINTIIRRDEISETGNFLQPCIEAALNLGCTLRRASRSQRNCHPRCYLSPNTSGFNNAAKTSKPGYIPISPLPQNTGKIVITRVSAPENVKPLNHEKLLAMSNYAANNSFAAYPLYYGNVPQIEPLGSKGTFALSPPCQEEFPMKRAESGVDNSHASCDLSLRLGPLPVPIPAQCSVIIKQPRDTNNPVPQGIVRSYREQLPMLDNGFSFFPRSNTFEPLGSQKSLKPEEASARKRKAGFDQPATMGDQRFGLQSKLPFRNSTGS